MKSKKVRALVYGDADLNVIDGSAVWVQSSVQTLASVGCDVTLLLKTPMTHEKLVGPLLRTPGVTVKKTFEDKLVNRAIREEGRLSVEDAVALIHKMDKQERFDILFIRGFNLAKTLVADGSFNNRLWIYLTDIPQAVNTLTPDARKELADVISASRFLLCQTDELRSLLETLVPEACGRTALLPPIVPDPDFEVPARKPIDPSVPAKLVYMGKFAPDWNTLEMTGLAPKLARRGRAVEVHMIGDKVHRSPETPGFAVNMTLALTEAPGVVWHGGVSRQEAWRIASQCDVGLSWRNENLDDSLELSTKLLEYGRLGLPVVLNRTPMHETLLGTDYPLFVDGNNVVDVIELATTDNSVRQLAAERCAEAAKPHSLPAVAKRVRSLIDSAFPVVTELATRPQPLKVLVASHDLKFFTRIQDYLASLPGVDLKLDFWPALREHDEKQSARLNEWADVVICEWLGYNAAWYSKHKRPGQRLIARLHRFELFGNYPNRVFIDKVDQVVCVSPYYAQLTREKTGWPAEKIVTIPNWVDVGQLDRPKLANAEFALGIIGIAPIERKRLDRGLDILADLRKRDRRFHLHVKTKMPWDYPWIWAKPEEQEITLAALARIREDPDLRDAVTFDGFGADVAAWLRQIGFVLSTSDDESFHLAPAEGMGSGAVPVIINWPGSDSTYSPKWIHESTEEMAESIYNVVASGEWESLGQQAKHEARSDFGLDLVCQAWARILTHNMPPATSAEPQTATGEPAGTRG